MGLTREVPGELVEVPREPPLGVEAEVSGEKESEGRCAGEASEKDKGERMGSEREEGDQK